MITYKSESNIMPKEWDIQLTTVYHNYNIVEKVNEAIEGREETEVYYVYDVDEYTLQEYQVKAIKDNSDTIDDILCMVLGA